MENHYLVSSNLKKHETSMRFMSEPARVAVMWYLSADILFWQLSIDHNMDELSLAKTSCLRAPR